MNTSPTRNDGDEGLALITVLVSMFVVSLVVAGAITYVTGAQSLARRDQNWNAALSAAEAGIDDYMFRVSQNANYWQYCSADTPNATCPPPDGNTALYTTSAPAADDWTTVSGSDDNAEFAYQIRSNTFRTNGAIELASTGRVGNSRRTVVVTLRRRSFLNYLYFTDFETKDPRIYDVTDRLVQDGLTRSQIVELCGRHFYDETPGAAPSYWNAATFRDKRCTPVGFDKRDNITGPGHSNDALLIYDSNPGTPFSGDISSSWRIPTTGDGKRWWWNTTDPGDRTNPSSPRFSRTGDPALDSQLSFPADLRRIRTEATRTSAPYGCLYTGPTRIIMEDDGEMQVWSPFTKVTSPGCPNNGSSAPIPANGAVYVQSVPSDPTDANYTAGCPYSASPKNGHPLTNIVPFYSNDANFFEPIEGYRDNCRSGAVFIQGTTKGQLTIGAEHNIIITDDLKYATPFKGNDAGENSGLDLLGLVAKGSVQIYHPFKSGCSDGIDNDVSEGAAINDNRIDFPADPGCRSVADDTERNQCKDGINNDSSGTNRDTKTDYPADQQCTSEGDNDERTAGFQAAPNTISNAQSVNLKSWPNPTVQAAILSLDHSFEIQHGEVGASLGTLNLTGAVAQRYRGILGSRGASANLTGLSQNLVYDKRLSYLSPPHFLSPVESVWQTRTWREIRSPR